MTKSYFYADSQVLKQVQYENVFVGGDYNKYCEYVCEECNDWCWYKWIDSDPDANTAPFYYIHDRLGSVRLLVDVNGTVVNSCTYNSFGEDLSAADCNESVYNPFKFTGQQSAIPLVPLHFLNFAFCSLIFNFSP